MRTVPISVAMIGDCAWVGETLIKYAPPTVRYIHKKRSRGLYSKTVGILFKILLTEADVFHVHYGLQDHYLVKILKRQPTVCQFHGSDLRYTLKTRLGWVVRKNLKTADRVLVSVPDIIDLAKSLREDAEYLPNPVDLQLFKSTPLQERSQLNILFASGLSLVKGADIFFRGFARFQSNHPVCALTVIDYGKERSKMLTLLQRLNIRYRLLPQQLHSEMPDVYQRADIVATGLHLPYLHMTSLEAMACHRPVIQYVDGSLYDRGDTPPPPPVVNVRSEDEVVEGLASLMDPLRREEVAKAQERYVQIYHNPSKISLRVAEIYDQLL